jgi:hypothetical protein
MSLYKLSFFICHSGSLPALEGSNQEPESRNFNRFWMPDNSLRA